MSYSIKITNTKGNGIWGPAIFDTAQEANGWLEEQKLRIRRRPQREILASSELFNESDVLSERFEVGIPTTRRILASSEQFNEVDVISEDFVEVEGQQVRYVTLPFIPQIRYVTLCAEATYEGPTDLAKPEAVTAAYNSMNAEVYAQMSSVFGTTNPDSASAYERTWNMMKETPSDWSAAGLKDDLGAALDTDQKVLDFATAKVSAVKAYGIWRMQRIQQFKDERTTILNS